MGCSIALLEARLRTPRAALHAALSGKQRQALCMVKPQDRVGIAITSQPPRDRAHDWPVALPLDSLSLAATGTPTYESTPPLAALLLAALPAPPLSLGVLSRDVLSLGGRGRAKPRGEMGELQRHTPTDLALVSRVYPPVVDALGARVGMARSAEII